MRLRPLSPRQHKNPRDPDALRPGEGEPSLEGDELEEPAPVRVRTLDPMTGRVISPLTAAALCVKPRVR